MKARTVKKTAAAILLAVAVLLAAAVGTVPAFAGSGSGPDLSDVTLEPIVSLTSASLPSSGQGTFQIQLRAANKGADSHTVTVEPKLSGYGESIALSGVKVGSADGNKTEIAAGAQAAYTFTFAVVNASTRMYTVPFILTDELGNQNGTSAVVKLTVSQPSEPEPYDPIVYSPSMGLTYQVSTEDGALAIGEDNILTLTVMNDGDCILSNTDIQLGMLPDGVSIVDGTNRRQTGTLYTPKTSNRPATGAGAFHIDVSDKAVSGIYPFPVTLSGTDPNGSRYSVTETLYLRVVGAVKEEQKPEEPDTGISTPILMVSAYSQDATALAGKTFGLRLTIQNTSQTELRNIKVTVGDGGGHFVPSGSSNAYYIASVASGAADVHTMRLTVNSNAPQATIPVTVSMSYEDTKGHSYNSSDTIAIPVVQETRIVMDNLSPISYAWAGETTSAELPIYNMGKNTVNNVKVTVSGDFDVTKNANVFIGNMTSGQSYTYKFNMVPYAGGTANGVITLTYDNAAGQAETQELPFSFEVQTFEPMDPGDWEDPGEWEDPEPVKGPFPWKWVGIGGGAALIAAFFTVRGVKKKKAAKALELEDDEPEEQK